MPSPVSHHGRSAVALQNSSLQAVFTPGGGHLAALRLAGINVNPLWEPPWPSIEPDQQASPLADVYGTGIEGKLLSGILGHHLCLGHFGGPSAEEAKQGLGVHGEAPVRNWRVEKGAGQAEEADGITMQVHLPITQMDVMRRAWLLPDSPVLHVQESVTSRLGFDRPFGWCQHVTLGEQFLEEGHTFFDASVNRGRVYPFDLGGHDTLASGEEFIWPNAPRKDGKTDDLRIYPREPKTGDFVSLLTGEDSQWAWFTAMNIRLSLLIGYIWKRADFPWLDIWEENRSRTQKPWNGQTVVRGLEFANQPMPANYRTLASLHPMLGQPALAWLPAKATLLTAYSAWLCRVPTGAKMVRGVYLDQDKLQVEFDSGEKWSAACRLKSY